MDVCECRRRRFVSGSALKIIAMASMLIDHTAVFILSAFPMFTAPFLTALGRSFSIYSCMRSVGRVAFPIYCFLLTEGFVHTRDRKKYAVRLFTFALISELPWNFVHSGKMLYSSQNVMFTLLLGYLALWAIEYFKDDAIGQAGSFLGILSVCFLGGADYGVRGLGLILILYLLRKNTLAKSVCSICMLGNVYAGLAFVPIALYSGERGFMRGRASKYAAYLFYPVHLLILGIIRYYILF